MPGFQVSTRSRNGVRWTMPAIGEIEREQQPELHGLIERADDRGRDQAEAGERAVEVLRASRHSAAFAWHRVPFAQRLRVARRDVGIVRIGADRAARSSTSARTCVPSASFGTTATPCTSSSRNASAGPSPSTSVAAEVMRDLGEIDVDQRGEQVGVGDVDDRAPPRARSRCACSARSTSSAPVTTRRTSRTFAPFLRQRVVAPARRQLGKQLEMHRAVRRPDSAPATPPRR